MDNCAYNLHKWIYGPLLTTGRVPPTLKYKQLLYKHFSRKKVNLPFSEFEYVLKVFFVHQKDVVVRFLWSRLSLVIHLERHKNHLFLLAYIMCVLCLFNQIAGIIWMFGQVKSMIGINFLKKEPLIHNMREAKLQGSKWKEKHRTRRQDQKQIVFRMIHVHSGNLT